MQILTPEEEIELIIGGLIDTAAYNAFWGGTPIQEATRRIARARGGAWLKRLEEVESAEEEYRQRQEREARWKRYFA